MPPSPSYVHNITGYQHKVKIKQTRFDTIIAKNMTTRGEIKSRHHRLTRRSKTKIAMNPIHYNLNVILYFANFEGPLKRINILSLVIYILYSRPVFYKFKHKWVKKNSDPFITVSLLGLGFFMHVEIAK